MSSKIKLSQKAITLCKNSIPVQAKLMLAFSITNRAVQYWFKNNSERLTTAAALTIIKEETGLTESEILTDPATI